VSSEGLPANLEPWRGRKTRAGLLLKVDELTKKRRGKSKDFLEERKD